MATAGDRIDPATFGERWAEVYDDFHRDASPSEIAFLADLARGGRALELGIGTGRFALPLAATGAAVEGIDLSEGMVAKLRQKPGGTDIPVTIGDFAEVGRPGPFDLVFVVFNTLFVLLDQASQVRCFGNVAKRLKPDGAFVIEAFVPDLARFQRNQWLSVGEIGLDHVRLDAARHDPVAQHVTSQTIFLSGGSVDLRPVRLRYAWPSELDLMAQLAGLRLHARWADWSRSPFNAASTNHVSVYVPDDSRA